MKDFSKSCLSQNTLHNFELRSELRDQKWYSQVVAWYKQLQKALYIYISSCEFTHWLHRVCVRYLLCSYNRSIHLEKFYDCKFYDCFDCSNEVTRERCVQMKEYFFFYEREFSFSLLFTWGAIWCTDQVSHNSSRMSKNEKLPIFKYMLNVSVSELNCFLFQNHWSQ